MRHTLLIAALALPALPTLADPEALKAAIGGGHRLVGNVARDPARHPLETLSFFGVKPTDTVIELSPGAGGWYTEILAPYLRDKGQLIAAADDPASPTPFYARGAARFAAKLASMPVYDKVRVTVFDAATGKLDFAPPASADKILTFRNVHNWMASGGEAGTKAVFAAAYAALKPGGVLGVVEHRLPAERPFDPKAANGYVHQAYVVKMAESVGFRLEASAEINANAKDSADHEGGVWALPPVLRNQAKDRERYLAIGESDRMTLRFVKPR